MSIGMVDGCCWLEGGGGAGICICAAAVGMRTIKRIATTRQMGHMERVCQIQAKDARGGWMRLRVRNPRLKSEMWGARQVVSGSV
jgi:hypothetical protein